MSRTLWKLLSGLTGIFVLAGCTPHYYCCTTYGSVQLVPPKSTEAAYYIPQGSTQCMTVPGGWHGTYWMPEHRVCQYEREQRAWVAPYWRCDRYRASIGSCMDWRWVPAHWAERNAFY